VGLVTGDFGFADAMMLACLLSAIPLSASLLVGLIVSVFQAATQIQEQTLSFVPKLFAVGLMLYLLGPWGSQQLIQFSQEVFSGLTTSDVERAQ